MVVSFSKLLTTLLLALAVAAHPTEVVQRSTLVNVPLFKRVNTGSNVVKSDQLRAESLKAKVEGKVLTPLERISSPATNKAVTYVASVGVGSPATNCMWLSSLLKLVGKS
jgi:cathepsin E